MALILTHRGLDPSKHPFFLESSAEAFADQLRRGYGLEFDLQFTKDGEIAVFHDSDLGRVTSGKNPARLIDLNLADVTALEIGGCRLTSLAGLLEMIAGSISPVMHAIHLKSRWQETSYLDKLFLKLRGLDRSKFVIFDVKPETAEYLKGKDASFQMAPSVAHRYDIERYNSVVGGTLISAEDAVGLRHLYDWVWLDEWDRKGPNGERKSLYEQETFVKLRGAGYRLACVSPELHKGSPGLLGGESHEDASDAENLEKRWAEILGLEPDVICTDFPDRLKKAIGNVLEVR